MCWLKTARLLLFFLLCLSVQNGWCAEADIEAESWPEFDIFIGLDKDRKNRIIILNSYARAPEHTYQETALGVSFDRRFSKSWSWRAGLRYIAKEADPPDTDEVRGVFDLKWFRPLGRGWLLTDRNRVDIRYLDKTNKVTYRYRNRIMLEKPFRVGKSDWTGFASVEFYYDSSFNDWIRTRLIGGVSIPVSTWGALDVFYGYHLETQPNLEDAEAVGLAFSLFVYK